ncbi:unnamed protein product [Arabidopsis halleri]
MVFRGWNLDCLLKDSLLWLGQHNNVQCSAHSNICLSIYVLLCWDSLI